MKSRELMRKILRLATRQALGLKDGRLNHDQEALIDFEAEKAHHLLRDLGGNLFDTTVPAYMRRAVLLTTRTVLDDIERAELPATPKEGQPAIARPLHGMAIVTTNGPEQSEGMALLARFFEWMNEPTRTPEAHSALMSNYLAIARTIEAASHTTSASAPVPPVSARITDEH